ncbi:PREDICTED: interleukin-2 receptor subunit beta [Condylura cristata]|uniref:interleukin-2 receptor subunit beta n=1 Tax=Condylura cristata TaxID=143302 RepID=UPI00033446F1|nr:PREDICTED: interleukin-2 receptor subunit beta [Condylura cristata]
MAAPTLPWRLSLLLLALVLLQASTAVTGPLRGEKAQKWGPAAMGGSPGAPSLALPGCPSSLSCFYNSKANISCVWSRPGGPQASPCRIYAKSDKRTWSKCCDLRWAGEASWACNLHLGDDDSQSLTAADTLNLTVMCRHGELWRTALSQLFKPFENLRMMAPNSLQVTRKDSQSCNVTWKVPQSSHYLEKHLVFEVRLRSPGQSWEEVKLRPINQNQQWIFLDPLAPDTPYELQVHVKPEQGSNTTWSPWSKPLPFRTRPTAPGKERRTYLWLFHVVGGLSGALSFVILVYLLANCHYIGPWLKKVLKCHIPDPSEYFAQLSLEYGGDFQKWLSSPFPSSSFHAGGLEPEISPLEVLDRDTKPMQLLRLQQDKVPSPSPSGHSLTSCFTNQGYFFFHLPDALEIEACQVYFTYDPCTEEADEGEPGAPQECPLPALPNVPGEDDAYCTFPPGEDLLLFSPNLAGGPAPLNTVPVGTGAPEEKLTPSLQVGVPRDWVPQPFGPPSPGTSDLVDFQSPVGDTEDEVPAPDSGERPDFPWANLPGQGGVRVPTSGLPMNTDVYLSLQELQDQDPAHSA